MPNNQFIRKVSLIVYGNPPTPGGTGLAVPSAPATQGSTTISVGVPVPPPASQPGIELGDLRIQFQVNAMDLDAPPTAIIRVFNLAEATAQAIKKEFSQVTLQAGYENGNFGVIFQGTIIRVKKGRLSNIDSFVDIMASNLDAIYNFGVVNKTVKAGTSRENQLKTLQQSINGSPVAQGSAGALQQGLQFGSIPDSFGTGGVLPRGKVMFGLARDYLTDISDSGGSTWQVGPDGKVNIIKLTDYLPGEAVMINSQTGMVGVPEATTQGIEVNTLLNPNIKTGTRIQLNNADINQTTNQTAVGFPVYSDFQFFANTNDDGIYRAFVVEHEGDSRGEGADWLTKIIALSVDPSGSAGAGTVPGYG